MASTAFSSCHPASFDSWLTAAGGPEEVADVAMTTAAGARTCEDDPGFLSGEEQQMVSSPAKRHLEACLLVARWSSWKPEAARIFLKSVSV